MTDINNNDGRQTPINQIPNHEWVYQTPPRIQAPQIHNDGANNSPGWIESPIATNGETHQIGDLLSDRYLIPEELPGLSSTPFDINFPYMGSYNNPFGGHNFDGFGGGNGGFNLAQ